MVLETLYSARLERWRGLHIILSGWQRQPHPTKRGAGANFPQRWWLQVVLDPSAPPMSHAQRARRRELARTGGGLMA